MDSADSPPRAWLLELGISLELCALSFELPVPAAFHNCGAHPRTRRRKPPQNSPHAARLVFAGQCVLPDSQHAPAALAQGSIDKERARVIGQQFPLPKSAIARGPAQMPRASVPETAIDKHDQPCGAKNKIRLPKHRRMPSPARDAVTPEQVHQRHFRRAIPARTNAGHHLGALGFGEHVRHGDRT